MAHNISAEVQESRRELLEILPPGAHVRTILRHVSQSGMTRHISPVISTPGHIRDLTWAILRAELGFKESRKWEGITMGGCGMDMGFALVYSLSRSLYPNGFPCIGRTENGRCPSNDHSNEREPNYTPGRIHSDGGYALTQSWL